MHLFATVDAQKILKQGKAKSLGGMQKPMRRKT
jgi:hypothetical protein